MNAWINENTINYSVCTWFFAVYHIFDMLIINFVEVKKIGFDVDFRFYNGDKDNDFFLNGFKQE